jgi:methylthioribose-1-phosphate isomerase
MVRIGDQRAIWLDDDGWDIRVIDQRALPHAFRVLRLETAADAASAIREMAVRGAPLIGATGAYGVALAARANPTDRTLSDAENLLKDARPTGANLAWAVDRVIGGSASSRPRDAPPPPTPTRLASARKTSRSTGRSASTARR